MMVRLVWYVTVVQIVACAATYTTSNEDFANPERGFLIGTSYDPVTHPAPLDAARLRRARANGMSLVRMSWNLMEYRGRRLDPAILDRVRMDLATVRECGMKAIGRFEYNSGPLGEPDAPLDIVLQHIDQLRPILRENSDVLAFLEAGFIGSWGEWHHSTNDLMPHGREILMKLLAALPQDRIVALRDPWLKMEYFGREPLTANEAFTGTAKARVGAHDDCFLASRTDMGTYTLRDIDAQKAFYHQDNLFVPQGGETCNFAEDAQPFIGCDNALRQLAYQRFNSLNSLYQQDVLGLWEKDGCMPEIRRRLGYRFRFVESATEVKGREITVRVTVQNDGFGNLYNPRPLFVVFRERATGKMQRVSVDTDPRRWMPGERSNFEAKGAVGAGEYDVMVQLPDASERLADRAEYAVRFANVGVWEEKTGTNRIGDVARVK
jgi:hypothetical protein